jgi:hypothetical protein
MPIRADSPCSERWDDFDARAGGRHCGSCDVTVVDLTRLTRRRAEKLVRDAGGRLCARMRVDRGGAPVFSPEPHPMPSVALVAASLFVAACEGGSEPASEPAPVAPTATLLLDTGPTSGSLMTTEHAPMRPLPETSEPAVAEVVLAPVEELGPTPEQLLLTEAKEEREESARERRRSRRTAVVSPGTLVHPLPPIGTTQNNTSVTSTLYLGGISYVP